MKWTYHVAQKMKIAVSLTFVIIIVLATNFLNKSHFSDLQESFTSVYRDRLLAEIYIFNFTRLLDNKSELLLDSISPHKAAYRAINDSISETIQAYEATVLTEKEADLFDELKVGLLTLDSIETQYVQSSNSSQKESFASTVNEQYEGLFVKLDALSEIQKEEGKLLIDQSTQIVESSKLTLQLELIILIVIAAIIHALLFSAKTTMPKVDQNSNLN